MQGLLAELNKVRKERDRLAKEKGKLKSEVKGLDKVIYCVELNSKLSKTYTLSVHHNRVLNSYNQEMFRHYLSYPFFFD